MNHEILMRRALALARTAEGHTEHYPMVGAVLVKNGKLISEGYFKQPGEPHAEVKAIRAAGGGAKGATLVVNLEPCSHFGRTPPCADAIIRAGIKTVVAGMKDPNPLVSGGGFRRLRRAGIEVMSGVLEKECRMLNRHFIKFITVGTPWVTVKLAATLDGKIADRDGNSKWITSELTRKMVHQMRGRAQVIMVGIGTILKDDPRLSARPEKKFHQPRPLIVDEMLRMPLSAKALKTPAKCGAIVACTSRAPKKKSALLQKLSAEVVRTRPDGNGRVDLKQLMKKLGAMKISSVLCEGGSHIAGAMIEQGLADEIMFFFAPKLLSDARALTMLSGSRSRKIHKTIALRDARVGAIGPDFFINAFLREI
jgi:diaminohydroxyphosphoribosylaminopyrimidine deaminase / 5-amino-6-(5-phosphoribosylamino)uracil reductase